MTNAKLPFYKRTAFVTGIVLLAVTIALFIFWLVLLTNKHPGFIQVQSIIDEIQQETHGYNIDTGPEYTYTAFVNYVFQGVQYNHIKLDYYDGFMKVGQTFDIIVNPNNPIDIHAANTSSAQIFLLVAWIATLLASAAAFISMLIPKRAKTKV